MADAQASDAADESWPVAVVQNGFIQKVSNGPQGVNIDLVRYALGVAVEPNFLHVFWLILGGESWPQTTVIGFEFGT